MGLTKEAIELQRRQRVGERRMMKCGREAEIVEYREYEDIDVKFVNDNIVVEHVRYDQFKLCQIAFPGQKTVYKHEEKTKEQRHARLGERKVMNSGYECEITEYINSKHIAVRFLIDDTIVENRTYADFSRGNIKKPKTN